MSPRARGLHSLVFTHSASGFPVYVAARQHALIRRLERLTLAGLPIYVAASQHAPLIRRLPNDSPSRVYPSMSRLPSTLHSFRGGNTAEQLE